MKKRKNSATKIGFIFIILILSLASISVSYGGLKEVLKVYGTVDTWQEPSSISDFVWLDQNQNGIQDPDEPGVPNVIVNLYKSDGTLVGTTITNSTGFYIFDSLSPGEYYVEFILPDYLSFTIPDLGLDDEVDSDVDPSTGQTTITLLQPGENDNTWDAGLYTTYEGCTTGFWKNHQSSWEGYNKYQTLGSIFDIPSDIDDLSSYTLLEALYFGGGDSLQEKAQILFRAAVAALLNAAHSEINYPLSETEIIDQVDTTLDTLDIDEYIFLKDTYDLYNNFGACYC